MVQHTLTIAIEITLIFAFLGIPGLMVNDLILGFKKYRAEKKTEIKPNPQQYSQPAGPTEPHHYEPAGPKTLLQSLEKSTVKKMKYISKEMKIKKYSKLNKEELKKAITTQLIINLNRKTNQPKIKQKIKQKIA